MTDDLAARLLAAIEETEDDAKAATDFPGVDQWMWDGYLYEGDGGAWSGLDPLARNGQRIGAHIARQDPHATLIRCAADRKILTKILPEIERSDRTIERDWPTTEHNADDLLRAMAEGYGLSTGVVDDECE